MEEDGALGSWQATRGRENRLCAGGDPGLSGPGPDSVGGAKTAARIEKAPLRDRVRVVRLVDARSSASAQF